MSNCAGMLVNNACAYALKSDGIVALCRMATCTQPPTTNQHSPTVSKISERRTHMLQQSERKHRQHFHIVCSRQLSAASTASHRILVRSEDLRHFIRNGVPCIFKFRGQRAFDGFVCEVGNDRYLVNGAVHFGEVGGRRYGGGYYPNATFACGSGVNVYCLAYINE